MSYQDFLDTLVSPINSFINWLSLVANSLIHNYIVITLLGITLFISLVWFIFYLIFDYFDKINNRYDDYNDKFYNYELLKDVQIDYLNSHYLKEFDYRYRNKVLNSQVLNAYLSQNKELDIDNRRLANSNKMESLKQIKNEILGDNDPSNDSDLDLIIPPKPQKATFDELKLAELKELDNEIIKDNNKKIDSILLENGYIDYKGHLVDINTGEIVNSNNSKKIINLGQFAYYDRNDKVMKHIALPVIDKDDGSFQFDNDNLSDIDRDFIMNHTLIRK